MALDSAEVTREGRGQWGDSSDQGLLSGDGCSEGPGLRPPSLPLPAPLTHRKPSSPARQHLLSRGIGLPDLGNKNTGPAVQ